MLPFACYFIIILGTQACVPIPENKPSTKPIDTGSVSVSKGLTCIEALPMPPDYCGKQIWELWTYKEKDPYVLAKSHNIYVVIVEAQVILCPTGPPCSKTRPPGQHFVDPGLHPDTKMQACAFMDEPGYLALRLTYSTE